MNLEELEPEEIKSRIADMDEREAIEFFGRLSPEIREKYMNYIVQRARAYLSSLIED